MLSNITILLNIFARLKAKKNKGSGITFPKNRHSA